MKRRQQQLGCRFLYLQLLQKHQNPFPLNFFFYLDVWLPDIFPRHHQVNLHSLWNLSTKVLATFLHKAIQLYPFRVITHLFGHGIIRGRRITTQQNFHAISIIRPASFVRTPQSYASGLGGTITLLLPSNVWCFLCEFMYTRIWSHQSSPKRFFPQLLLPP